MEPHPGIGGRSLVGLAVPVLRSRRRCIASCVALVNDTGWIDEYCPVVVEATSRIELRRAFAHARRRAFRRGEVVFHEGDLADVHLVVKGEFAAGAQAGAGKAVIALFSEGDIFGVCAHESDCRQPVTVVSVDGGGTLALPQRAFHDLLGEPAVGRMVVDVLVRDLERRSKRVLQLLRGSAEARVFDLVLELTADGSATIRLPQSSLADLAGTSRATVNRLLRREQRRGTIDLARGRVSVLDPTAIHDLVLPRAPSEPTD